MSDEKKITALAGDSSFTGILRRFAALEKRVTELETILNRETAINGDDLGTDADQTGE